MPKLINRNISVALSQKNIHYKIIKLIILKLLLSATPLLAHYELPIEIDLMMIEHDLNKCSKGKIDSYFFHKEKDPDYWLGIYTSSNLDLECLREQFQNKITNYPVNFLNNPRIKVSHDLSYYKSYITNFNRVVCGERCYLDEDSILFVDDNYWYIYDLYNSYGHKANFIKTLDNKIHIQLLESTHIKNIVFDINTKDFLYLYDGILEFHDDYYIATHSKSYFYGGGAFWYSAKRDYQNNILELIDLKTNFSNCEDTKLYSWSGQLYDFILETNNLQNCREH